MQMYVWHFPQSILQVKKHTYNLNYLLHNDTNLPSLQTATHTIQISSDHRKVDQKKQYSWNTGSTKVSKQVRGYPCWPPPPHGFHRHGECIWGGLKPWLRASLSHTLRRNTPTRLPRGNGTTSTLSAPAQGCNAGGRRWGVNVVDKGEEIVDEETVGMERRWEWR